MTGVVISIFILLHMTVPCYSMNAGTESCHHHHNMLHDPSALCIYRVQHYNEQLNGEHSPATFKHDCAVTATIS